MMMCLRCGSLSRILRTLPACFLWVRMAVVWALLEPHEKRFVAEGREQRLGDGADFQDAEKADIELRDPVHEQADPVLVLKPEAAQEGADGVAWPGGYRCRCIFFSTPLNPSRMRAVFEALPIWQIRSVAVPADVDDIAGLVPELFFRDRPGKIFRLFLVGPI